MKKKSCALLALTLLLALLLTACGSSGKSGESSYATTAASYSYNSAAQVAEEAYYDTYDIEAEDMEEPSAPGGGIATDDGVKTGSAGVMKAEKIIYTAYARLETIDYENAIQGVYDMVERFGGFMESTSISGTNYYNAARGRTGLRSASFTIRVPSENFATLTSSLSELGNVPYCNTSSTNVTARYYDTESRMNAYKTQEARLLEMLEIAETVEDMLKIQQQLTEVQYQIDSLQSTLTNYDRQVNYSTVNLDVQEVEEYTEQPVVVVGYWEKMANGFKNSLKSVGEFFSDLFLWFISNLPAIIVWVVVIFLAVRLFLHIRRKRKTKDHKSFGERRAERKAKRRAKKLAKKNGGVIASGTEENKDD